MENVQQSRCLWDFCRPQSICLLLASSAVKLSMGWRFLCAHAFRHYEEEVDGIEMYQHSARELRIRTVLRLV